MSYPVFATGDVLNASDMNAVGLWLVKTQTVGTGVSSVTVTGAFSSDFENYLIVVNGGVGSAICPLRMTLGSTATGYYSAGKARTYAGVDINVDAANTAFWYAAETDPNGMTGVIQLQNPQLATRTLFNSTMTAPRTAGYWFAIGGYLNDASQYTAFTFTVFGGTQTGGTIRVYGYRN